MPASEKTPAQLKDWFDDGRYRSIADGLSAITARFDRRRFLKLTRDGLEGRSLMERLRQTAVAINVCLPGTYRSKVAILRKLAPAIDHGFVAIFLSDFVALHGLDEPVFSLEALRYFTRYGSAEFAIRPFLVRDQESTLATMLRWTSDRDENVRRLSSEGCRPRLPWGMRLQSLVRDPSALGPILDALNADPSLYVRKSVANNLNDITKDHPDWVMARLGRWDLSDSNTAWLAKRACRTLIKRGHPEALTLFGFGGRAVLDIAFAVSPGRVSLGDVLKLDARIQSTSRKPQRLAIDYVVHYRKANGGSAPKVFKWTELDLSPGESVSLVKRQTIRDFTTRRHHAGLHVVCLQVNGQKLAEAAFQLTTR